MTDAPPDLEHLATALASAAGLEIRPEHLPGVAANLGRLMAQARLVTQVAVATEMEPAPVFRP